MASSSAFPSRAVYIREPTWPYITGRGKRGGPQAERGATWKPFYGAAKRAPESPVRRSLVRRNVQGAFGVLSHGRWALTKCVSVAVSAGSGLLCREAGSGGGLARWSWNGGRRGGFSLSGGGLSATETFN